eukprot:scaffold405176_cov50-Prasinocladus_malaysianus.AAC.1
MTLRASLHATPALKTLDGIYWVLLLPERLLAESSTSSGAASCGFASVSARRGAIKRHDANITFTAVQAVTANAAVTLARPASLERKE